MYTTLLIDDFNHIMNAIGFKINKYKQYYNRKTEYKKKKGKKQK